MDPNSRVELAQIFKALRDRYAIKTSFEELTNDPIDRLIGKVSCIIKKVKSIKSGRQLQELLKNFQSTEYKFNICFISRKRKAEEDLYQERSKRQELENELKAASIENEKLREINLTLGKQILKKVHMRHRRGHKDLDSYSRAQRHRIKKNKEECCRNALDFLRQDGLTPLSLAVMSKNNIVESIQIAKEPKIEVNKPQDGSLIESVLHAKDRFSISHGAYHALAMTCSELPRRHKVQRKINFINSQSYIKPIPGTIIGFEQSIEAKLRQILYQNRFSNDIVRVKLSGDGTWVGKRIHLVNVTFTLPDLPNFGSATGNNLVAIFYGPEKYQILKEGLQNVIAETTNLTSIQVKGKTYAIEFYLGGDLKFLNLVCGLDACSSKYAFLWCKLEVISNRSRSWTRSLATLAGA